MMMSTAACVSIWMASTVSRVDLLENLVERTAAKEFAENFLRIAERERESKNEVILERIVLRVSSSVVVPVICFVVS